MNNEFIPYEQNLEIRNLGFDEPCIGFYNIDLDVIPIDSEPYTTKSKDGAILYQQAFRWFREKYDLHVSFGRLYDTAKTKKYIIIKQDEISSYEEVDYDGGYTTYQQAELACLKKLIEIVKNK